ncbi:hypothetical protein [Solibacillus sp. CAU 1738]|uniref:hypothetical protein n=1 Tax=Solibacillus sp. CAU 1738 TaxID=3140363 RepID=UPI003260DFA6
MDAITSKIAYLNIKLSNVVIRKTIIPEIMPPIENTASFLSPFLAYMRMTVKNIIDTTKLNIVTFKSGYLIADIKFIETAKK